MIFWLVVACFFETSCGSESGSGGTGPIGAAAAAPARDAQSESDGSADTGQLDANLDASADTGAADTGAADTGVADTGAADTGAADTGVADTGPGDSSSGEVTYGWDPYVRHACYRALGTVDPHVSQPNLTIGGGVRDFEVHLGSLFRGYTGWSDAPPNWAQVSLTGIYIGIEVWGRGRVWMEHKHYRVWSPS